MNIHSNITPFVKVDRSNFRMWEIRDNAETRRLSADDRRLVLAAIKRHNERIRRGDWRPITCRTDYVAQIEAEVSKLVVPLVHKLYRTNVSGDTTIRVKLGNHRAIGYTSKNWNVYSKRTRYPGHDAHIEINVMHGWRRHVAAVEGLATAGGMLTTHATQIDSNTWSASWLVQGRGVDINVRSGFIVRDGDEWIHAVSIVAAQRMIKQRRAATRRNELAATLRTITAADIVAAYGSLIVTVADSKRAGNCVTGTANFIERYYPGRTQATVAELMAAHPYDHYVRKAVAAAIVRQSR